MKNEKKTAVLFEKLKIWISKNKRLFFTLCVCFVLLALVALLSYFSSAKQKSKQTDDNIFSVSDYTKTLETKLENMLMKIDGVDFVDALVMVESTPKTNFLFQKEEIKESGENDEKSTVKETVVLEKNGSVSSPVVVSTTLPKITGVLIVTSKISSSTKVSIISSLSIVLNIDESCISILQER